MWKGQLTFWPVESDWAYNSRGWNCAQCIPGTLQIKRLPPVQRGMQHCPILHVTSTTTRPETCLLGPVGWNLTLLVTSFLAGAMAWGAPSTKIRLSGAISIQWERSCQITSLISVLLTTVLCIFVHSSWSSTYQNMKDLLMAPQTNVYLFTKYSIKSN